MMEARKREALEAAGFRIGDAGDFLGLSDEERRLVDLRAALAMTVRLFREAGRMSQKELATRIGSSQSRVAKIEAAAPDVSLDLMFRGLFAAGGDLKDVARATIPAKRKVRRKDTQFPSKDPGRAPARKRKSPAKATS
jgi:predicted XRE-type DNA-binding protein